MYIMHIIYHIYPTYPHRYPHMIHCTLQESNIIREIIELGDVPASYGGDYRKVIKHKSIFIISIHIPQYPSISHYILNIT